MTLLALDTSSDCAAAALSTSAGRFLIEVCAGASHSELLFDMIDDIVRLARVERESIDAVACPRGPGSWTGLRIGYSAAQGIAFALNKRCVTVPTLDVIALPHAHFDGVVIPALDAKQQRFFCALYRGGTRQSDYLDASPAAAAALLKNERSVLVTGNAAPLFIEKTKPLCPAARFVSDPRFCSGRALDIISYIEKNPDALNDEAEGLLYLRKSDAEMQAAAREC